MNEIEFRLERTPVDESDDEVQHEEIPTGKYIAPIFDKRLKHFRVMEGSPITFTCKIVGIPVPKVCHSHCSWWRNKTQLPTSFCTSLLSTWLCGESSQVNHFPHLSKSNMPVTCLEPRKENLTGPAMIFSFLTSTWNHSASLYNWSAKFIIF